MHDYFATCPKGIEYLLRDELVALGAIDVHEALAGVHFKGALEIGYRACLWSRLASRILIRLAEFDAPDEAALYAGVQSIDWAPHLAVDGTLAVDAVSNASALRHTQYISQRVKDALVDQFRERTGARPDVNLQRPSIRLNLWLRRNRAILSLDFSGTPLHRRGWRVGQGDAPLKENLACAILLRGGWPEISAAGGSLVDPMCGAATLLIEAALMASDSAPGIKRDYFGFLGWLGHDQALWTRLKEEAAARSEAGLRTLAPVFFGYDDDARVLAQATRNIATAGLDGVVRLAQQSVDQLQPPPESASGLVVCNPPYGERLGEREHLDETYRQLGQCIRVGFTGWRAAIITSDDALARDLGLHARKRYVLFNGALECRLLVCEVEHSIAPVRERRPLSAGGEGLANRIAKNARHLRKRLMREAIGCYRVYDADIPEYAAAIDVYTAIDREIDVASPQLEEARGRHHALASKRDSAKHHGFPQTWLHVQEYAAPRDIPAHDARLRLAELVRAAGVALDVPRSRIAVKSRQRVKGGIGHGHFDARGDYLLVEEGGLALRVNLFDHLDTGLFLDHRPTRSMLRGMAHAKRFLNLFCYTASATAYAAAGGAANTSSVDLSPTYLDWAARNLALNDFTGARHRLIQADAMQWLAHDTGEYDLIFVDPPTFSNSRNAANFDVQRDHVQLLLLCKRRLAIDGTIVFSTNNRRFRLDRDALDGMEVDDVSTSSIPFDFSRSPRIHQCYTLRRRDQTIP
ncbi:MAG: bifunctional 23S rRNA (guanine(2069)-N(7))-methyltransferase RlmK/23S rRNA (guanine(2445)-N(2))-methyltransferase RlmL [Rhodanobacteraceae bacterium]